MTLRTVLSKVILLPCSKLYGLALYVRNKLFDYGLLTQHEFSIPVICVGNLAVGGAGKTPHTEYIIDALRLNYNIAVLSRGYKRSTKGFVLATPHSRPNDIGDEAYQMYHKFGCKITVAVCESRVAGIKEIQSLYPDINLIVLDDAFQHRYVKPALSILVTEYSRPVFRDSLLPYGRLRESKLGVNRADIVVVTKCPEIMKDLEYRIFSKDLNLFPYQSLFFSHYEYQPLVPLFPDEAVSVPDLKWMTEEDAILAIAGIDNPRPFIRYLKSFLPRVRVNIFGDHHKFTRKDLDYIHKRFDMKGKQRIIVTTEKDAVRLACNPYFPKELRAHTFYLPIKVEFNAYGNRSFTDTVRDCLKRAGY